MIQSDIVAVGKSIKRGLFIVFEGLDRSGKSTQSALLAKYLKEELELPVKTIAFPSKCSETGIDLNIHSKRL